MKEEENKLITKKVDIFVQAAEEVINNKNELVLIEDNVTVHNVALPIEHKIRKTWKELKVAIDNEHAKRFNDILNNLPDREFTRIYLKALEFFKPKVIRQAGARGEVIDQTINIQINYGDKK